MPLLPYCTYLIAPIAPLANISYIHLENVGGRSVSGVPEIRITSTEGDHNNIHQNTEKQKLRVYLIRVLSALLTLLFYLILVFPMN